MTNTDTNADKALTPGEYDDFTHALRCATAADDAGRIAALMMLAPFDSNAYAARLRALADAVPPDEPCTPEKLHAEQVRTMRASALPGHVIEEGMASAIVGAMQHWYTLKTETPQQKAIREAFAKARRLMDELGDQHPVTLSAVFDAVELSDPGCCDRMLKECGIHLPEPTHVNAEGQGLLTLEQVAQALDADPEDLMQHVEQMEAAGLDVRRAPAGWIQ